MHEKKVMIVIIMVIVMVYQLLGEIKAAVKLLITTANGEKPYNCVMIISKSEISLECDKKIFQLFNEFETPKQSKIKLDTAEVEEIQIQIQNKKIYIITKESFTIQYRNIFNRASKTVGFSSLFPVTVENWALIFVVDNPVNIKAIGDELIKIIGERCEVRSEKEN